MSLRIVGEPAFSCFHENCKYKHQKFMSLSDLNKHWKLKHNPKEKLEFLVVGNRTLVVLRRGCNSYH